MKIRYIFSWLLLFSLVSNKLEAQSNPSILNVIPPSPEASSLMRYLDYPVSNATGIPDINIPLYVVKSGQLNIPISLSYHSSGRKVYDRTGAVGLGWTLNAGGMISRTIYGDVDGNNSGIIFPNPWKKATDLLIGRDFPFLSAIDNRNIMSYKYDTEYDIFSYSVNGLTGNFILKDVQNDKVPVFIPKKPYTLQYHFRKDNLGVGGIIDDYFELVDENGIYYKFGNFNRSSDACEYSEQDAATGWMLTDVISANKEDTIHFTYQLFTSNPTTISTIYRDKTLTYCYEIHTGTGTPCTQQLPYRYPVNPKEVISNQSYGTARIKEISFKQGKVVFNLQDDSNTLPDHNLLITSVEIKNSNNTTIKKIEFNRSRLNYFTDNCFLEAKKLDNIVFKDQTLTSVETYSFDYYPVKYPGTDKAMNVRYLDMWGYYNAHGCSGNCILIDQCPFIPNTDGTAVINNPNNDRVSDEDAMKSGVLSKITYPTGGYTEFFYQMNKYKDQATVKDGSGLRIYQIKSTDGNNHTLLKTYKYGSNECGYGDLPLIPTSTAMKSTFEKWLLLNDIAISTTINTKETETDYFSNILPVLSYIANLPVFYTYVTEYQGDETNNVGKILYTYSQGNTSPLSSMPMAPSSYQLWKKSNLLQADFYTKTNNPSNPYSLVKTSKNTYTETTYPSETIDGLWIKRNYFIVPPLGDQDETVSCGQPIIENNPYLCPNSTCPCIADFWYAVNQNLPIYFYSDYTIEVGKNELTGTTETISTDAGDFTTTISYTYNANHLLSNKTIKSSKNENISTDIKYPFDYSGNTVLSQMVTLNMLNFPVEQIEKKDNTFLQSTKTNYNFFQRSTVNIAPSSIDVTHGSNAPETRLRYLNYDNKGNILSQSKENDVIQSYIWGYNQTLPIVKAENIDYTTLYRAFSSALSTAQIINFSEITVPSLDADQKAKLKAFNTALQGNAGLAKAMITTYTYTPLIGMTSSTAPNGVTTYYEYDDFGRLKCIRDDDGHILKTYEYHYKP